MTTTNYLNPDDFRKLVNAVPLVTDYNKSKLNNRGKSVPDPDKVQLFLDTQYCHGLRVSECLDLHYNDFDFKNKILSLNHTKTGWKKCKSCKGLCINPMHPFKCEKCEGRGKIRKKQFTSIPPDYHHLFDNTKDYKMFPFTRQLIWEYVKKAAKFANLELAEQQDERLIIGAWTHLIRKSRAKMMIEKGASEVLVKVKLRHAFTTTERYTRPDINALIEWETKNIV